MNYEQVGHVSKTILDKLNTRLIDLEEISRLTLAALFSGSHVLYEGVPGLAKTLLANSLSQTLGLRFSRTQGTVDLLPADLTGGLVYNPTTGKFSTRDGPIFTNILLVDEINRIPPKTQSALLESMQEHQVTIDGTPRVLPAPFFVIATQNPLESEGVFRLPEAQLDRFAARAMFFYPSEQKEQEIYAAHSLSRKLIPLTPVVEPKDILTIIELVDQVRVSEPVLGYVAAIIRKTREQESIELGASPRSGLALIGLAKAYAAMNGRDFVEPDDVKKNVLPALNHRIILTPEAEISGLTPWKVLESLLEQVAVQI
ncbi:MAG: AAA family ATPase [Candidatus Hodarchaeales archaeon]|jgi:MoxR-like ATPase